MIMPVQGTEEDAIRATGVPCDSTSYRGSSAVNVDPEETGAADGEWGRRWRRKQTWAGVCRWFNLRTLSITDEPRPPCLLACTQWASD